MNNSIELCPLLFNVSSVNTPAW